jgi:hypothetical protein
VSNFQSEIAAFLEGLVPGDNISGFANEVQCYVRSPEDGPSDAITDKFVMEYVTPHFGEDAITLKAIATEPNSSGAGEHEFVIEFARKGTSDVEFVKMFIDNVPQDMDGDSFCVEFIEYKFVKPEQKMVTTFA